VSKGKRAEEAIKANPNKSDRVIAEELGDISQPTVSKIRKTLTDNNLSVEKRVGKDGKTRRLPIRTKRENGRIQQSVEREARVAELMDAGKTTKQIAAELDMHERCAAQSMEHVRIARAAEASVLNKLDIDPDSLSLSAQAKLEATKRMLERKLNAEYAARMRNIDEEVRQRVLSEGKEYLAYLQEERKTANTTIELYRERINNNKPLFSPGQFKTILMCLHPDGERTAEKLSDAFRLFNGKKLQLTGEK